MIVHDCLAYKREENEIYADNQHVPFYSISYQESLDFAKHPIILQLL